MTSPSLQVTSIRRPWGFSSEDNRFLSLYNLFPKKSRTKKTAFRSLIDISIQIAHDDFTWLHRLPPFPLGYPGVNSMIFHKRKRKFKFSKSQFIPVGDRLEVPKTVRPNAQVTKKTS